MKTFLAVFLGSKVGTAMKQWEALDEATRKSRAETGMKAWHAWMKEHEKALDYPGAPLGKTKKIEPKGISDVSNALTGFTIVRAESHEAAAKMFTNHPHFSLFPGDSVEVMECKPIPGM